MNAIRIFPNSDLNPERTGSLLARHQHAEVVHLANGAEIEVHSLTDATSGGKPSVGFVFGLPDGRPVLVETTLALFLTAADALKAVHGDPRT